MGTTGLARLISEALAMSKAYRETIHSFQEATTSNLWVGRSSSLVSSVLTVLVGIFGFLRFFWYFNVVVSI